MQVELSLGAGIKQDRRPQYQQFWFPCIFFFNTFGVAALPVAALPVAALQPAEGVGARKSTRPISSLFGENPDLLVM